MKKITLLAALIVASSIGYAQKVYDFTGSANPGSWVNAGSGTSVTPSANGLVLEFNAGVPRIDITRAASPFSVSDGTHMIVTLVNNNTEIGSFSGFFDKNNTGTSGTQFLGFQTGMLQATTPGTGVEATYVFKLESTNYQNDISSGSTNDTDTLDNMEYVGIRFRQADGSTNLSGDSATNGNIVLKKIEIVNAGSVAKNTYDFATNNTAGFGGTSGGVVSDGVTVLNFAGDGTKATPKLVQDFFAADASNQFVHIVVDANGSNADQVKFQFIDASSAVKTYGNQTLIAGTIDMDLSSKSEWTGTIGEWRLVFSESGGGNIDTGLIEISEIIFDNSATLNLKESTIATFSMFPNPANNILNLRAKGTVKDVKIFDITGKQVFKSGWFTNSIELNISTLNSGVYLVKVEAEDKSFGVKKLILK